METNPQSGCEQSLTVGGNSHEVKSVLQTSSHRAAAAPSDGVKVPPVIKNVLPIKLEPNSAAATDSCPYPAAALKRGDTGTVILLVYVAPDGRAADAQVETSSAGIIAA